MTHHRPHPSSNPTFSLPPQHKNQNGDSKCNKQNKLEQNHTKINKIDRIVILWHKREKLPFTNKNKQITNITNKSKTNYN